MFYIYYTLSLTNNQSDASPFSKKVVLSYRKHYFSKTWRSDHNDVMTCISSDHQTPLHMLLSFTLMDTS
jgi:hypothetical protein